MLACARLGAIHSVVFGGFAANELAKRIDDAKPKLILSASCGIEVNRVIPYKPLLDGAIELAQHKVRALRDLPAAAGDGAARARARPRLERGAGRRRARRVRAGCRHRPALHPVHLGHDGHPQGRRARQRRPRRRAQVVDERRVRHGRGRVLLGGLRHRLGGRPLLHRLRAAAQGLHHDPLRGQAGGHARSRRVLAPHRRARRERALHGADRVPRDQEGGPARDAHGQARPRALPHAVPRGRALRSRHAALGGGAARACPSSTTGGRRRPAWPIAANCVGLGMLPVKPGSPTKAVPGLRRPRAGRGQPGDAGRPDRLDRPPAAAAARMPADALEQRRRVRDVLPDEASRPLPDGRRRLQGRRTATSTS